MQLISLFGSIVLVVFIVFAVLLMFAYLFLPFYFKNIYSREYDGSYDAERDSAGVSAKAGFLSPDGLSLSFNPQSGTFRLFSADVAGGQIGPMSPAFENGLVAVAFMGRIYSNSPKSGSEVPLLPSGVESISKSTPLGSTLCYRANYNISDEGGCAVAFSTEVWFYEGKDYAVFRMEIPDGVEFMPSGFPIDSLAGLNWAFPVFENRTGQLRVLAFRDTVFCPPQSDFRLTHGPVALFDDAGHTVLISALDHFFTSAIAKPEGRPKVLGCGIGRNVRSIPRGYCHHFIMVFGKGINATFRRWGDLLRQFHGAPAKGLNPDIPTSLLGYFTDNGAHYYYNTERGLKADATLLLVDEHARGLGLPFRYYQIDSWWYQKSVKSRAKQRLLGGLSSLLGGSLYGGTLLWEPDPHYWDMTPLELSDRLGKPLVAHNRWFEPASPYAQRFRFKSEKGWIMPDDPLFWEHIMTYCRENRIIVYEQDWMSNQLKRFLHLTSEIGAAEKWLSEMAEAARKHGVTVQYCMQTPACLLQSVRLSAVTHARCCDDYHGYAPHSYDVPGFTQTSIFADAVGLRPFKDVFKTTKRGRFRGERNPLLMAIVASLSTGPVAPGDQIGFFNVEIIMGSCTASGRLLKPDRPLTATDRMFLPNRTYYVCAAVSIHGAENEWSWLYTLTVNLFPKRVHQHEYTLRELGNLLEPGRENAEWIEYNWRTREIRKLGADTSISQRLKFEEFEYRVYAPILPNGVSIIGEPSKYCTFSRGRFEVRELDSKRCKIEIKMDSDEHISLLCYLPVESVQIARNGRALDWRFIPNSQMVRLELLKEEEDHLADVLEFEVL